MLREHIQALIIGAVLSAPCAGNKTAGLGSYGARPSLIVRHDVLASLQCGDSRGDTGLADRCWQSGYAA